MVSDVLLLLFGEMKRSIVLLNVCLLFFRDASGRDIFLLVYKLDDVMKSVRLLSRPYIYSFLCGWYFTRRYCTDEMFVLSVIGKTSGDRPLLICLYPSIVFACVYTSSTSYIHATYIHRYLIATAPIYQVYFIYIRVL